jgi:cysteine desulfurase/selenocysteine lyase
MAMIHEEMMSLSEFKKEFQNGPFIHFNNAGLCPISNRVSIRATEVLTELNTLGSFVDQKYLPMLGEVRACVATYLGAEPSQIAFFQNCGSALSQLAFAMNLNSSDTIVTLDQEYASNFYPWSVAAAQSGSTLKVVKSGPMLEVDLDALLSEIKPGVKCVAVSWVQFQTGTILDLKIIGEQCRAVGAKFVVDGIQGIGQLPVCFRDLPIDALVGGSHKWLGSLNGQAFMAIKDDWVETLRPLSVGAGTYNRFSNYADESAKLETTARRFEAGGLSFISLFALESALQLQMEVGVKTIATEISRLTHILRSELKPFESRGLMLATPFSQAGGITSFQLPIAAEAKFLGRCQSEQIAVIKRGSFIRTSLHAFNSETEINRVLDLLEFALTESSL